MSDVMQALQAYAARQKNMSQDQMTQVPGVGPSGPASMPGAGVPSGMTMPQAQFSNPGNRQPMSPQQMQQLIMLLQQRQQGAPQGGMPPVSLGGAPPPM